MHPVRAMILKEIPTDGRTKIYDLIMKRKRMCLCWLVPFVILICISFIPVVSYIKSQMPDIGTFMEGYILGGLIAGGVMISVLYWSIGHNMRPPTDKERKELRK